MRHPGRTHFTQHMRACVRVLCRVARDHAITSKYALICTHEHTHTPARTSEDTSTPCDLGNLSLSVLVLLVLYVVYAIMYEHCEHVECVYSRTCMRVCVCHFGTGAVKSALQ